MMTQFDCPGGGVDRAVFEMLAAGYAFPFVEPDPPGPVPELAHSDEAGR